MNEVERNSMKHRDARLPARGASGLVLAGVLICVLTCAVPSSAVQISGRVTSQATGAGVDGVAVVFSDGGGSIQTANGGWYTNEVEESWSGAARPDYGVRKFAPASRAYTNTTADQTNQDFAVLNELAWDYVREVEVAHAGAETLTNHQVSLTLEVAAAVGAGKMRVDGGDIRFMGSDGVTPLPYWIEQWETGGTSRIWIKLDGIPAGTNVCAYLYYGNPDAASRSAGEAVFEFFDDFSGATINTLKWQATATTLSLSNGVVTTEGGSVNLEARNVENGGPIPLLSTYRVRMKLIGYSAGSRWGCMYYDQQINTPDQTGWYEGGNASWTTLLGTGPIAGQASLPVAAWHTFEITYAGGTGKSYCNNGLCGTVAATGKSMSQLTLYSCRRTAYDYVFVARFNAAEPVAALGDESLAPAFTISGRITDAGTAAGLDGMALMFSNEGGSTTTSGGGYYAQPIAAGWSGTVTPVYVCGAFSPGVREYADIQDDQTNQDFEVQGLSAPESFDLVGPTNGETAVDAVHLRWTAAPCAAEYDVYAGTNPSPAWLAKVETNELIVALTNSTVFCWHVVARNAAGETRSPAEGEWSFQGIRTMTITGTAAIATNDWTYEDAAVVVNGGTVTIDGAHEFYSLMITNGGKVVHSAATASQVNQLDLTINDMLAISSNSAIDVSGRGYLPGRTLGNTTNGASANYSGGSHGGLGGGSSPNVAYGDYPEPAAPGAGGAGSSASAGGGCVNLRAGTLELAGAIRADGGPRPGNTSGGGAGGSIRIAAGMLSGSGSMSACGGAGYGSGGGGGGGRIALYFDDVNGFDLTNGVKAMGGTGGSLGGAGTIYWESAIGLCKELRLEGIGSATGLTPLGAVGVDRLVLMNSAASLETNIHIQEIALTNATVSFLGTVTAENISLAGTSVVTHASCTANQEYLLDLVVSNTLSIGSNSAIDVSGRGYLAGRTLGNTTNGASANNSGGSHGGLGGGSSPNAAYGDYQAPAAPGAGGAGSLASAGGGCVNIQAGTLELAGAIRADGGPRPGNLSGGGAGGGIRIAADTLRGSGSMSACGGAGYGSGGGGGGGRMAILYQTLDTFDLTNNLVASGGTGGANGSAGTIYTRQTGERGMLRIENRAVVSAAGTPLWRPDGTNDFEDVIIQGTNTTVTFPTGRICAANMQLADGAQVTHVACTADREYRLDLVVSNTLSISSNSAIDVSGRGYLAGRTLGNTTNGASANYSGGSHGGLGGGSSPNAVYGDYQEPSGPGAGGAGGSASAGGGCVNIQAGTLELAGAIRADGGPRPGNLSGGGAGGSIRIAAGMLSGSGSVSACGGAGYSSSGGGGGGRIALYFDDVNGFDLTNGVKAVGGTGGSLGGAGTIYWESATGLCKELRLEGIGSATGLTPLGALDVDRLVLMNSAASLETNIHIQEIALTNATASFLGTVTAENISLAGTSVVTHVPFSAVQEYGLDLVVSNTLSIGSNSAIDVSGRGYLPGRTAGNTTNGASTGSCGGSHGGLGGGGAVANAYGDYRSPTLPGGGGGDSHAGAGGGRINVHSHNLTLDGTILANGGNGASGWNAGGGAGGGIRIEVQTLAGNGVISACGGNGNSAGGGGGGGRVAVYYETVVGFNPTSSLMAAGGAASGGGSAGTIYTRQAGERGTLRIENRAVVSTAGTPLWCPDGTNDFEDLTIQGTNLVVELPTGTVSAASILVVGGARLVHPACSASREYGLDLFVRGPLIIATNCAIDVSTRGYLPGLTLGNVTNGASTGYSGGSYGGLGGGSTPNAVYGNAWAPNEVGSGGGNTHAGNGGGLVRLHAESLTVAGNILANGGNGASGWNAGGGSGGGLWVDAETLSVLGSLQAKGGNGNSSGGGGGGGRIAVYYDTLLSSNLEEHVSVAGGTGSGAGQTGSLYLTNSAPDLCVMAVSPSGHVHGGVSSLVLAFNTSVDPATLTTDDLDFRDPDGEPLALAALEPLNAAEYRVWLNAGLEAEGTYILTVGSDILSLRGGTLTQAHVASFTLDNTAPAVPTVTNYPAAPVTNLLRTTNLTLQGTRETDSAIWIGGQLKAGFGGETWSCNLVLTQGITGLTYYAVDRAGNTSDGQEVRFLADCVAPAVSAITPPNDTFTNVPPATVDLTVVEATSGVDVEHSTLSLRRNGVDVEGAWSAGESLVRFTPANTLEVGEYAVSVRLLDRVGNTGTVFSSVFTLEAWQYDATIRSNLFIATNDGSWEGRSVKIWGATVTVDGVHSFSNIYLINGAKLTHSPATSNAEYRLDLALSGELYVSTNSQVDVSGRGYLAGFTAGNTTNGASTGYAGGSYGGFGARSSGAINFIYGDFRQPVHLGSGGGRVNAGGGAVCITADILQLDGQIKANGVGDTYYGSGGSGGGVLIHARSLSGSGTITANGGNGYYADGLGGGGGGRVAVFFEFLSGFNLTNKISVLGGTGGGGSGNPGTVYFKQNSDVGMLLVAGPDSALNRTTTIWLPAGTNFTENILISGTNRIGELWPGEFAPANLRILSGGRLTYPAPTSNIEYRLELWVQTNLTVDGPSTIDVSGRGYLAGMTVGNTNDGASTGSGGGSYGGLGSPCSGTVNPVYGAAPNPDDLGSGGGQVNAGGGLVRITADSIQLDGQIKANGAGSTYYGAGGSGGGVYLDCRQLSGTGSVSAVGGDGYSYDNLGGGGGGRIAVYHEGATSFNVSTGLNVAGGGPSGRAGGAGTAFHTNQVAPAWIQKTVPGGNVTGIYSSIDVKVGNPLQMDTFTADDVQITGPGGSVAIQSLSRPSQFVYRLNLVSPIETEGTYTLLFGTNILTVLGGQPAGVSTQTIVLDHTAPAAPVVTNYPGIPATNWLRTTAITLRGTRDNATAVWRDTTRLVTNGTGAWSAALTLTQGLNIVALHTRDAAGNRSATNTWLFLADTVAPAVTAVAPPHNSYVKDPPTNVQLTFTEATSGLDLPRCAFSLKKSGVVVPGSWAATTNTMTYTPEGAVLDGTYSVAATLIDNLSNTGTFSSVFTVDTVAPPVPVLNPVTTPTTINQQTVTGTRESGTSTYVYRGGATNLYGSQSGGTSWSFTVPLTNGWNYWDFTARDTAGNESARTNVVIQYDNVAPGAVTVTGQVAGTGLQLTLGWSSYNELTNGNDIASYTVFRSSTSFTNVSQAQALGTNGAGNKAFVVTGLTRNETRYYAVMARDTSGHADSNVTSVGLAPVDVVAPPNPTGAVFTCNGTDLTVRWSASADPYSDLAGYKVYVTNETEGVTLPATTNEFLKTGLEESKAYQFRISAFDLTGNEGAGLVVTGYTLLPNPLGLTITPYDGFMSLSWQGVTPASNVGFYAIYAETGEYASVTGLARRLTTTGTTAQVAGFVNGVTNWLGVTTVNRSGGENPAVTPAPAVTVDDVWGPEVLNLKWQGGSAAGPATWPGRFTVQARDPVGIGRVEFRVNGAALAGETSGTTNFSAFWDVSATTNDGPYELVVNAYDTKGNMTAVTQVVNVALAVPPAPVITSPAGTTVVSRLWQTVSGTGAVYAAEVRFYINSACVATSLPAVNGIFSATLDLQTGTNRITAAAVNRAGMGTTSSPVTVVSDQSVPAAPIGVMAAAQADGVIRVSWSDPLGVNIKGYNIYRASSSFTATTQAARVNTSLVATKVHSDLPATDGTYYYRVSAVNLADTEGPLSAEASATNDRVAPKVLVVAYSTDGVSVPAENRYGRGNLTIDLTVSETLQTSPFFSLNPVNGTPISPALTKLSDTSYRGTFAVTEASPCGLAYATFSGRDAVGNRGTEIQSGGTVMLDVCGPVLAELNVTPGVPIRNDAANPTTVTVVAVFAADDVPVQTPELKWSLSQTRTAETAVVLSALTGRSWWGTVSLPADAGQPTEYLQFSYQGLDTLGNTGRTMAAESRYEVYQGGLPPLAAPEGLTGRALPSGQVALSWQAVAGAADYAVFKGPASNNVDFIALSGSATNYTETAGDGTNWYAVASVREANGQVSTGAVSAAVQVVADAAAPAAPTGLALSLLGAGIKAVWQPPEGEAVKYAVYRNGSDFSDTTELTARATNIAAATWTDPNPVTGPAYYGVVAVDAAGNCSPVSARAYTNLALLPVNSLQVRKTWGALPVVSWSHAQISGIAGYNLYAGAEGAESLLNGELGSTATQHVDTSYAGGSRRYALATVDSQGGVETESVRRAIVLPDLALSLPPNTVILRGVMNRLEYDVANAGAAAVTGAKLYARFLGVDHVSAPFDLEAGAQTTVAVVVGGYTNLGSRVVVSNRVELVPNAGELAVLAATNEIEVGTGMLVAEVLNDELIRGAEGKVRFALHNTSSEEVEVVLAQGGGASPEVRVKLEDADGMVYANQAAQQTLGNLVLTVANGQTVARIPAGESFTSADILLPVPTNVPNAVVLRLEIDRLHYHVAREDHVQISGLQSTRAVALAETRYYAEVTNVTPAVSFGGTNILIQGRAVNRAGGQAEQNAQVKLVISVDGFERAYTLYSDGAGAWSYTFAPLAGEAGTYRVWAVHPSVVAKPEQATFTIARVGVSPAVANLDLPRAYEYTLPITVAASKGNPLTNVVLSCTAADQPGGALPAGIAVVATAQVASVQGGQSAVLLFRLQGDLTAASTGQVLVAVKSDGGPAGGWGAVAVNYQLHTALPVLQWTPNYVQTGVAISNSELETVVLKNAGYAALEGVTLALLNTNGLAAPAWVRLNVATNVGTLAVGEERAVTLVFAPTGGVSETLHEFRLQVRASNYVTKDINLFAGVDGSGQGGALFKVTDIYTGTTNQQGGLIQGLAGATITLQKESGSQVVTSRVSDVLGEAQFADLPVGSYIVRVSASKHDTYGGRIWVKPGVVTVKEVFLQYNLVTVEWKVVPTTIQDQYEVVLTATFETAVPAPVVVIEPTSVALPDMKAGEVLNVELRIVNHGLIRAQNVAFTPPASDEYLRFELLTAVPATLEANQVLTIPYRITCLKSLSGEEAEAGGGGAAYCGTRCASLDYDYTCINGKKSDGRASGGCVTRACNHGNFVGGFSGGTVNFGLGGGGGSGSGSPTGSGLKAPEGNVGCAPVCDTEANPCCIFDCVGSDVGLAGGGFHDEVEDLSVAVLGGNASIRRIYGQGGWLFPLLQARLPVALLGTQHTARSSETGSMFANMVAISSNLAKRASITLTKADEGERYLTDRGDPIDQTEFGWRWRTSRGDWIEFGADGRMLRSGDRMNWQMSYTYDAATNLTGIWDHFSNQVLWIEYSNGLVSAVLDQATGGRRVTYHYDGSKRLTNVVDVSGSKTDYRYDSQNRLISKKVPGGEESAISYRADGAVGQVTYGEDRGKVFTFDYDESLAQYYASTRVWDGSITERWLGSGFNLQRVTLNGEDMVQEDSTLTETALPHEQEEGNTTFVREPAGAVRIYQKEPQAEGWAKTIDAYGLTNVFLRNAQGDVTNVRCAAGTSLEVGLNVEFDELRRVTSVVSTGATGEVAHMTSFGLDPAGNVTNVIDAEGGATAYEYDRQGLLVGVQNARGHRWTMQNDPAGQHLLALTDPLGRVTSNTFNEAGDLVATRDAAGRITTYEYNAEHHVVGVQYPSGQSVSTEYNADGLVTKVESASGYSMHYAYDAHRNLTQMIDEQGETVTTTYDSQDRPVAISESSGNTVQIEYQEDSGLPARIRHGARTEMRYEYNPFGWTTNITRQIDGAAVQYAYLYNPQGDVVEVDVDGQMRAQYGFDPRGLYTRLVTPVSTNTAQYDRFGHLVSWRDANGGEVILENNRLGQPSLMRRAGGGENHYVYDGIGQLTRHEDPEGRTVELDYDPLGRLTQTRVRNLAGTLVPDETNYYGRNESGMTATYSNDLVQMRSTWVETQSLFRMQMDYGAFVKTLEVTLDELGRPVRWITPEGLTNVYHYDARGNLDALTLGMGGIVRFSDWKEENSGRIEYPGGAMQSLGRHPVFGLETNRFVDAAGREILTRIRHYNKLGLVTNIVTEHGEYAYGYDVVQRIVDAVHPVSGTEHFVYDTADNLVADPQGGGVWAYNADHELLSTPGAQFAYDRAGNLTTSVVAGATRRYLWDARGLLREIQDGSSTPVARYGYDPLGRRIRKEVNGIVTWFLYGPGGLLAEFDATGGVVRTYGYLPTATWNTKPLYIRENQEYRYFILDGGSQPIALVNGSGAQVWQAVYETSGKALVSSNSLVANPVRGSGQYYDEESGLHYNSARYYDPAFRRFLSIDPKFGDWRLNSPYVFAEQNPNLYQDPAGEENYLVDGSQACVKRANGGVTNIAKRYGSILRIPFSAHTGPLKKPLNLVENVVDSVPVVNLVTRKVSEWLPTWFHGLKYRGCPGQRYQMVLADGALRQMTARINQMKMLYTHGYNDADPMTRSGQILKDLEAYSGRNDLDMVTFKWPGMFKQYPWPSGTQFTGTTDIAQDDAAKMMNLLMKCLSKMGADLDVVIAHSQGNEVALRAFLMGNTPQIDSWLAFQPAISTLEFNASWPKIHESVDEFGYTTGLGDWVVGAAFTLSTGHPGIGGLWGASLLAPQPGLVRVTGQSTGHGDWRPENTAYLADKLGYRPLTYDFLNKLDNLEAVSLK